VLRLSDRKTQPFIRTQFNQNEPRFSPDGRWLAYISDESGRNEIYVQPYPARVASGNLGRRRCGPYMESQRRELFYRSGQKMMVVDITTQPGFVVGTPRMLFEGRYEAAPVHSTISMSTRWSTLLDA